MYWLNNELAARRVGWRHSVIRRSISPGRHDGHGDGHGPYHGNDHLEKRLFLAL